MRSTPRHSLVAILAITILLASTRANTYEFILGGGERLCFSDFFSKGEQPSILFHAYKLNKDNQNKEITQYLMEDLMEKNSTMKAHLNVESASGISYTAISKKGQKKVFKIKESERVNLCISNLETAAGFFYLDLRRGVYAKDLSNVPTGEDAEGFIRKLEDIRKRLDNSLSLYRQMEAYEEKHLNSSSTVLSGVLLVSQIMIAAIALVGWGITMLLEKSLKYKKVV